MDELIEARELLDGVILGKSERDGVTEGAIVETSV